MNAREFSLKQSELKSLFKTIRKAKSISSLSKPLYPSKSAAKSDKFAIKRVRAWRCGRAESGYDKVEYQTPV